MLAIAIFAIFINVNMDAQYQPEHLDRQLKLPPSDMRRPVTLQMLIELMVRFEHTYGHRAVANNGIPHFQPRTSWAYQQSLSYECHDNLPQLIGLFKQNGSEAYPVFVMQSDDTLFHNLKALLTPGIKTHAAILIYIDDKPYLFDTVSIGYIDLMSGQHWGKVNPIFLGKYKYIVGLLSRHGKFYRPYFLPIDFDFFAFSRWFIRVISSRIWS
ncbi:hypothetical protein OA249_03545 [Litorivicinus sp.]|nr:hypothetical protein [Litorivicinus sp.]